MDGKAEGNVTQPGPRGKKMQIQYLHAENLVIDRWHPACGSADGILRIVGTGRIIDAAALREDPGARIVTDNPEDICRVLGISHPDQQIIKE